MLLLPISFVKDAARAVKRICKEEFTDVKDSVLTELLGISTLIVTMVALRKEGDYEVLHPSCTHHDDIAICPRCGLPSSSIHDDKPRSVRHLNIWGKKCWLITDNWEIYRFL